MGRSPCPPDRASARGASRTWPSAAGWWRGFTRRRKPLHQPPPSATAGPPPHELRSQGGEKETMTARRIIPCLDVRDGRVVKGVRFRDHRDIGDIVEHALRYRDEGADELVFYDITASAEGRSLDRAWVRRIARVIDIPFAVAGGIRTRDQAAACLDNG